MQRSLTFDVFKTKISEDKFIRELSICFKYDYHLLHKYIITSIDEAEHTLTIIADYSLKNKKLLEFGAGLGFASISLFMSGYNITSFEPGGIGFEKNALINQYIKKYFHFDFKLISDINEFKENEFDFIFSNNVLEHIDEIKQTLLKLDAGLTSNGIMKHNVPNYLIPYEPHFGIMFSPLFPKKSSFVLPKKIINTPLWQSINFINYFDIVSYAKAANANLTFKKQLTYETTMRIIENKKFAERHKFLYKTIKISRKLFFLHLLKLLPVFLNTPMIFEWRKNAK